MPNKPAYTPAEFAALFGKERTWGYRQIYAGKVNAVTVFGSIMVPVEEVEKAMASATRYGVSGNAIQRRAAKKKASKRRVEKRRNAAWKKYVSHQRSPLKGDYSGSSEEASNSSTIPIAKGIQQRCQIMQRLSRRRRAKF